VRLFSVAKAAGQMGVNGLMQVFLSLLIVKKGRTAMKRTW
jgi:hypothetical protein